jgi:hypothetical protein
MGNRLKIQGDLLGSNYQINAISCRAGKMRGDESLRSHQIFHSLFDVWMTRDRRVAAAGCTGRTATLLRTRVPAAARAQQLTASLSRKEMHTKAAPLSSLRSTAMIAGGVLGQACA